MTSTGPAAEVVRRLAMGSFVSQAVYVFAKLGIADLLAGGARAIPDLSRAVGAHDGALTRVLALLDEVGLVAVDGDEVALTETGACLASDAPDSVRSAAVLFGEEPYRAAGELLHTTLTGKAGFERLYGMTHFEYLESKPEAGRTFHDAMEQLTRLVAADVIARCGVAESGTVVDVGGGRGTLLTALLAARPRLRGVLFEAPGAVAAATAALEAANVADRCEVVAGDALDAVPAGGDVYLLKSVLHTLVDTDAERALAACRDAMDGDARLLVIERVIPADGEPGFMPRLNDVVMMAVTGGRERRLDEYRARCAAAGLRLERVTAGASGFSVLDCRRA